MSALDRRPLGRTGLQVGAMSFGTAPLSTPFWGNDEATAIAAARRGVELGFALFDTAPLYGYGEAEQRLGAALAGVDRAAAGIVVATKVGRTLIGEGADRDVVFDFSAAAVRPQLERSLERLGLDRVDIAHVHDPDDHLDAAVDECLPALAELRDEGLIGAISLGTVRCETASHVLAHADLDVLMLAGHLTLLDQQGLDEVVPECDRRGIPLLAAAVFASGVLARPFEPDAWFEFAARDDATLARAAELDRRCVELGVSLRAAAMAYPLRFAPVASVVVGMARPEEVDENVALLDGGVPEELWAHLGLPL